MPSITISHLQLIKYLKNNVDNKISDEILSNFHHFLEQTDIHLSSSSVFKTFSTKEITFIIKSIITKNAHGYDEISTKLLKISVTYIYSRLT